MDESFDLVEISSKADTMTNVVEEEVEKLDVMMETAVLTRRRKKR